MPKNIKKVVVFDLDDTIGHFEEISMFLSGLQFIVGNEIKEKFLFKLLDLWPHFLRPGILDILSILKKQKKKDKNLKVIIYTNNMGPRSWTLLIKRYLEKKLKSHIIDKSITAYRPFSKLNCRTTHEKTHSDFLKCSHLPQHTQILFLDDQNHPKMYHPNITYLKLYPYNYGIPYRTMIHTFLKSKIGKIIPHHEYTQFNYYMYNYLDNRKGDYKYKIKRTRINKKDLAETHRIKKELHKFLNIHTTRRQRKRKNKTRKN